MENLLVGETALLIMVIVARKDIDFVVP